MYCVLGAEPLVYLTNSIRGLVASCVLCARRRALSVSDQDYPRVVGLLCNVCREQSPWCIRPRLSKGMWPAVYCALGAEPLVYLTNIIRVLVACYVLCVGRRALGVPDQ